MVIDKYRSEQDCNVFLFVKAGTKIEDIILPKNQPYSFNRAVRVGDSMKIEAGSVLAGLDASNTYEIVNQVETTGYAICQPKISIRTQDGQELLKGT